MQEPDLPIILEDRSNAYTREVETVSAIGNPPSTVPALALTTNLQSILNGNPALGYGKTKVPKIALLEIDKYSIQMGSEQSFVVILIKSMQLLQVLLDVLFWKNFVTEVS